MPRLIHLEIRQDTIYSSEGNNNETKTFSVGLFRLASLRRRRHKSKISNMNTSFEIPSPGRYVLDIFVAFPSIEFGLGFVLQLVILSSGSLVVTAE